MWLPLTRSACVTKALPKSSIRIQTWLLHRMAPRHPRISATCWFPNASFRRSFIPPRSGYRTDKVGDTPPTDVCAVFDTETYPGKRSLEKRPINNFEWALICDGVAKEDVYDVLSTPEGVDQALAKLGTIKDDVIWWSAGAETPQLLADGEVVMGFDLQWSPVCTDRRRQAARCHAVGCTGLRSGRLDHSDRPVARASGSCEEVHHVRNRYAAPCRPGQVHLVRSGSQVFGTAGRQTRLSGHRHGSAHAD